MVGVRIKRGGRGRIVLGREKIPPLLCSLHIINGLKGPWSKCFEFTKNARLFSDESIFSLLIFLHPCPEFKRLQAESNRASSVRVDNSDN